MNRPDQRSERTVVLALLGALLFSQPLLGAFDAGSEDLVFGFPVLYLYLFLAWAALIGLLALVMESFTEDAPPPSGGRRHERDGD